MDPTEDGPVELAGAKRPYEDNSAASSSDEADGLGENGTGHSNGVPSTIQATGGPGARVNPHRHTLSEGAGEALPVGRGRGRGRGSTSQDQKNAQKATAQPATIPAAPPVMPVQTDGTRPLVNCESSTTQSESYTEDERALNEFTRLHPMVRRLLPRPSDALTSQLG